jgi:hypothetical protein
MQSCEVSRLNSSDRCVPGDETAPDEDEFDTLERILIGVDVAAEATVDDVGALK